MSEAGLERNVRALIERALLAIDDDEPAYGEPLRALAEPRLLAHLCSDPALGRALFAALRRLRPLPLWVRDQAELSLSLKRDLSLDGAVCTLSPGAVLPPPEGRECWLEVDAAGAAQALASLPGGFGLVVAGDLSQVSFAGLRRLSPLRALGAVLGRTQSGVIDSALARPRARIDIGINTDARLDLVIAPAPRFDSGSELEAHVQGARTLWSVESPEQLRLPPAGVPSLGFLCDGKDAALYALGLATVRLASQRPR